MSMFVQCPEALGQEEYQTTPLVAATYKSHGPMNISSNADFAAHGWNGTGTQLDPYSISGLSFDAADPRRIANTTAYFSIEDCKFSGDANTGDTAVSIYNATNGIIESCAFEGYHYPIGAGRCNSTLISSNIIQNGAYCGISLGMAFNTQVTSNTIENVTEGIELDWVYNSAINSNTVSNCSFNGIQIMGMGNGTTVSDNEIYNLRKDNPFTGGISLMVSSYWTILRNSIHDSYGGILCEFPYCQNNITQNNIYNCQLGLEIYRGEGVVFERNTIRDCSNGIMMTSTHDSEIIGNTIENGFSGLSIQQSTGCTIDNNHLQNCQFYVQGSTPSDYMNEVKGNTINDRELGYFVSDEDTTISSPAFGEIFLVNCTHVEIRNQVLTAGWNGVTMAFSRSCGIVNCTISKSGTNGIYIYYTEDCYVTDSTVTQSGSLGGASGIYMLYANATEITRNMIYNNSGNGIELTTSIYSKITDNLITNNTGLGVFLTQYSSQNQICGNEIGWNDEGNAMDNGHNNSWDDGTSLGNSWSDYNSNNLNNYTVIGNAGSCDNFPAEYKSWQLAVPRTPMSIGIEVIVLSVIGVLVILGGVLLVLRRKRAI